MNLSSTLQLLHRIFVPHARNSFRPHAIRHYGLVVSFALLLFVQLAYNYTTSKQIEVLGFATNVSVSDLHAKANAERTANGQTPYALSSQLNSAAQAKAQHMLENDYWSHYAPDGTTPWFFIENAGYSYEKAGENLAYGFTTSADAIGGWMDSAPHRANILDATFTEVGYGFVNGVFQGDENTIIVAMYGKPVPSGFTAQPAESIPVESTQKEPSPNEAPNQEAEASAREDNKSESEEAEEEPFAWTPLDIVRLENADIEVTGSLGAIKNQATTSTLSAVISGQVHWGVYASLAIFSLITLTYVFRHATAIIQTLRHGEHYIEGHPLLEAGIIYGIIWLILASAYGVVG